MRMWTRKMAPENNRFNKQKNCSACALFLSGIFLCRPVANNDDQILGQSV